MILNTTTIVNETDVVSARILYASTKLEFGPAWIWIGATVAILFVIVCMMWVVSRQLQNLDKNDETWTTETSHQLGQPTIGANFLQPLVNYEAPGLTAELYKFQPIKAADTNVAITELIPLCGIEPKDKHPTAAGSLNNNNNNRSQKITVVEYDV